MLIKPVHTFDAPSHGLAGNPRQPDCRNGNGGYTIVGETYPIAIGVACAVAMRSLAEVVIRFFGNDAVN